MSIEKNNVTGSVALFTSSNGRPSWWDLRLFASYNSGPGASITLKVNGDDFPLADSPTLHVAPGSDPQQEGSWEVRLDDGDVVSAEVDGGTVNLSLSGEVLTEML